MVSAPAGRESVDHTSTSASPPLTIKEYGKPLPMALIRRNSSTAAFWGLGEPINNQPFLNRSRMYIPVKDREPDRAKAKQLLAEAGIRTG